MKKIKECPTCKSGTFTVVTPEEVSQVYDIELGWEPYGADDLTPQSIVSVTCTNCGKELDPQVAKEWVFGSGSETEEREAGDG